jgi:hypothetical protein
MKIYAISLVKNEVDIIEANLNAAKKWADKIYILDNGSSDGTWEIVQSMASDIIIPYKRSFVTFSDSLRREVFEYFRKEFEEGDWICFKLDADEFYIDNPRTFLSNLPTNISLVFGLNVEFQYTEDNNNFSDNIFDPNRFKYAKIETTEQRFLKYRHSLIWNENDSLPIHPGIASNKLIKFAHYQYRTPSQIENRLKTRTKAINEGFKAYWDIYIGKNWVDLIIPKNELYRIDDLNLIEDVIQHVKIKSPEKPIKRIVKYLMHSLGIWS